MADPCSSSIELYSYGRPLLQLKRGEDKPDGAVDFRPDQPLASRVSLNQTNETGNHASCRALGLKQRRVHPGACMHTRPVAGCFVCHMLLLSLSFIIIFYYYYFVRRMLLLSRRCLPSGSCGRGKACLSQRLWRPVSQPVFGVTDSERLEATHEREQAHDHTHRR